MNDRKSLEAFGASSENLELLHYLLAEEGVEPVELQHIQPRTAGEIPLSFAQQRLWFLDQMEAARGAYNISAAYSVSGRLDPVVLERALKEVIRRHEVLRTVFQSRDGLPFQVVESQPLVEPLLTDLSQTPDRDKDAEVRRRITANAEYSFDLSRGPLFRASLLRLGEERHILLLCMHHIVSDGWSMSVLFKELAVLYEAFTAGKASPLAELPIQYADFAIWQREWLRGDVLQKQLEYWKKQLAGIPILQLATDRLRPALQSYRGAAQSIVLGKGLVEALRLLSRNESVTLFITLLAAFHVLLYCYTGQEDIVVGSPIAGRNRSEIEGLIGFFVNSLVLRGSLSGNPTFRELLARSREMCFEAYAHQELPFDKLVEELQPERNLNHHPLFQVMFILQNTPIEAPQCEGVAMTLIKGETTTAKFDLTLSLQEEKEGLRGSLQYSTDLFDAPTMARMVEHYRTLLEAMVADPDRHIAESPMLTGAERQRLLVEWNDTQREYPQKCIHELFETQVEQTPEATAIVFEDRRITYRELNRRANQLARFLRNLGVGPEVLTGICVERSVEMVVGILGILKAGGAYVPLDPKYPKERLAFILEDTQAPVMLTQQHLVAGIRSLRGPRMEFVCLDTDWPEIAGESDRNPHRSSDSASLAYVMYTSGSTGVPKGVSIEHRSVVRLVKSTNYAGLSAGEVFLQFAPLSFDAATFEIWGSLLNGSKLVVFPPHMPSLEELGQFIAANRITTLWLTAALFVEMVDSQLEQLQSVAQLLAGGDVLPVRSVNKVLSGRRGGFKLINGYGPTENTTFTCCRVMDSSTTVGQSVEIGRPIANTQVYILDQYLQPVPIGVPGELYAGGDGLAREYHRRPELTAERFLPNPFGAVPGGRLYKTGDRARYLPDGNIEFLGRIDGQVKIRGFRIETGEIEAVLGRHPAVAGLVVVARDDTAQADDGEPKPAGKRLVAYIVPKQEAPPSAAELRLFLEKTLPDYMTPSAFVFLNVFPLTPTGKVDRKALPAQDQSRPALEQVFVAPRTPTERALAEIWEEVLGLETVGCNDNFFDLGGHSLLATQVVSRLRKAFDIELPVLSLFDSPTVAGLAEHIETVLWAGQRHPPGVSGVSDDREELKL